MPATTTQTHRTEDGRRIATMRISEIMAWAGCSRDAAHGLWRAAQDAASRATEAALAEGLARVGATVVGAPGWRALYPRGV